MAMSNSQTIFLTGFPGFIASRLVARLAQEPFNFLLLVQPQFLERASRELEAIFGKANRSLDDFRILQGDITQVDLGLAKEDLSLARNTTNVVFHLAAYYDLAVPREPALRVNVLGTQNVNNFTRSVINLEHYHYISTCYVAGQRTGLIFETELEHDAGFRNHYEETKYLAEMEVEKVKSELPITIHRPAVVCGDSRTGETAKYDGIYYLIHYLLRWPSGLSIFNIGNHKVTLNLVPIDFVVDALAVLATDKHAIGKTLQIADSCPLTTHELFNQIARCIEGRGSIVTIPARLVEFGLMLPPSPAITHLPHSAVPYFFLQQTYDTFESTQLLAKHEVHCPSFPTYVKAIVEFAKRNQ
ncbi:MAG TPA: SDR family oxidoreductase [Pyrinomonadaceae bacterium]|jgi:thioester reductase-like protein